MKRFLMTVCMLLAGASDCFAQGPSLLDRLLPPAELFCNPPDPRCVVAALQKALVPVGMELEIPPPPSPTSQVPFQIGGMTVRELLDKGVETDKRYAWREVDGVPVVRLKEAWDDSRDPLSRRLPEPLVLRDVSIAEAIAAVQVALDSGATPGVGQARRTVDETRFSVRIPAGPLLNAVNAIVSAHGSASWLLATITPGHPSVSFYKPGGYGAVGGLVLKPIDP